jgi:hypothetical protein
VLHRLPCSTTIRGYLDAVQPHLHSSEGMVVDAMSVAGVDGLFDRTEVIGWNRSRSDATSEQLPLGFEPRLLFARLDVLGVAWLTQLLLEERGDGCSASVIGSTYVAPGIPRGVI